MNIHQFWQSVLEQDANTIREFFNKDGYVNWHCTNEHFSVEEYIQANCKYPGDWSGEIERVETMNDLLITVTRVYPKDKTASFHVTSFFKTKDDKILSVDKYWADDGEAPDWRKQMKIGKNIR